jgi:hypothetical protein
VEDALFGGGESQMRNCVGKKRIATHYALENFFKTIYIYIMNKNTKMMKGSIIHLVPRKNKISKHNTHKH